MKKKLKYYGGQGFYNGKGKCTVKYDNDEKRKDFSDYESAKIFYDSLETEKALWQTRPIELVICHVYETR